MGHLVVVSEDSSAKDQSVPHRKLADEAAALALLLLTPLAMAHKAQVMVAQAESKLARKEIRGVRELRELLVDPTVGIVLTVALVLAGMES